MILSEYSSRLTSRCCSAASNETEWHRNWSVNERRENMREKMLFFSSGFLLRSLTSLSKELAAYPRVSPRPPDSTPRSHTVGTPTSGRFTHACVSTPPSTTSVAQPTLTTKTSNQSRPATHSRRTAERTHPYPLLLEREKQPHLYYYHRNSETYVNLWRHGGAKNPLQRRRTLLRLLSLRHVRTAGVSLREPSNGGTKGVCDRTYVPRNRVSSVRSYLVRRYRVYQSRYYATSLAVSAHPPLPGRHANVTGRETRV